MQLFLENGKRAVKQPESLAAGTRSRQDFAEGGDGRSSGEGVPWPGVCLRIQPESICDNAGLHKQVRGLTAAVLQQMLSKPGAEAVCTDETKAL